MEATRTYLELREQGQFRPASGDFPDVVVERVAHPTAGDIGLVRSPMRFGAERPGSRTPPPRLGEHGREVLVELGYADGEIGDLLAGACKPR